MKSKLFWAIEYIMPTTLGVSNFVVTSSWVYHLTRMSDYLGFGEPWISGNVNLLQGKVDLKFRIEGAKGECTVCFLSKIPRSPTCMSSISQRKLLYTLRLSDRPRTLNSKSVCTPHRSVCCQAYLDRFVDITVLIIQSDTRSLRTTVRSSSSHDRRTSGILIEERSSPRDSRRVSRTAMKLSVVQRVSSIRNIHIIS